MTDLSLWARWRRFYAQRTWYGRRKWRNYEKAVPELVANMRRAFTETSFKVPDGMDPQDWLNACRFGPEMAKSLGLGPQIIADVELIVERINSKYTLPVDMMPVVETKGLECLPACFEFKGAGGKWGVWYRAEFNNAIAGTVTYSVLPAQQAPPSPQQPNEPTDGERDPEEE